MIYNTSTLLCVISACLSQGR